MNLPELPEDETPKLPPPQGAQPGEPAPDASDAEPAAETADEAALLAEVALGRAKQAMRLASGSVPHLSGLARLARLKVNRGVSVAAVAASGLTLVNPDIFAHIPLGDAAYILAHELMHLALDTHNRAGGAHPLLVNFAHDYVINDILSEELERDPPLNGLKRDGARNESLEELVVKMSQDSDNYSNTSCWSNDPSQGGLFPGAKRSQAPSPMKRALQDAGLVPKDAPPPFPQDDRLTRGDLIPPELEAELEPEMSPEVRDQMRTRVRKAAAKAASLAQLRKKLQDANAGPAAMSDPERAEKMMQALRDAYHTPWELALQRWVDATAPSERTYARPSRRGADRTDVVLPGRRREGWTLHIILDTSGSMESALPRALGAIGLFCDNAGVAYVHIVQCDTEVTADDWVEPYQLENFKIAGFSWSNMSPAMEHLADDPEVTAVMMLTDGYIDYLHEEPPYRMLWVLLGECDTSFRPAYGEVLYLSSGN